MHSATIICKYITGDVIYLKGRTQDKYASGPGRRRSLEPDCDLDKLPLTPYFPTHCRVPAPAIPRKATEPLFFGRRKRIRDEGTSDQRWTHPLRRQKETDKLPSFSSALEPITSSGSRARPNVVAAVAASKTRRSSPTVTPSKRRASKPPESDTSSNKRPRLRSPTPHAPQSSHPDRPTTESRQSNANPRGVSPGTQAIVDHARKALDDAHLASTKREEDLRNDVKFTEARLADARQRIDQLEREKNIIEIQLVAARQEHMPLHFLEFRREAEEAIQQLRQANAELQQENRGLRDETRAVCMARDEALKAAATADDALKAAAANASVEMLELRKARDEALKKAAAADDALKAAVASSRTGVETRTEQSQPEAQVVHPSTIYKHCRLRH
ncbi:hypothetical protein BDZ89DRAFT_41525 [Hymenopellis radicata]|nr:hypothetical protein BDZ89DRAFT_41525 [Hymenopellis radicata]